MFLDEKSKVQKGNDWERQKFEDENTAPTTPTPDGGHRGLLLDRQSRQSRQSRQTLTTTHSGKLEYTAPTSTFN